MGDSEVTQPKCAALQGIKRAAAAGRIAAAISVVVLAFLVSVGVIAAITPAITETRVAEVIPVANFGIVIGAGAIRIRVRTASITARALIRVGHVGGTVGVIKTVVRGHINLYTYTGSWGTG